MRLRRESAQEREVERLDLCKVISGDAVVVVASELSVEGSAV